MARRSGTRQGTLEGEPTTHSLAVREPTRRAGTACATPSSQRREDVVHRLLERGISSRALTALLPGWASLIARVARRRHRG